MISPPTNVPRICGGFALPVASGDQHTLTVTARDALVPPTVDADQLTFVCALRR